MRTFRPQAGSYAYWEARSTTWIRHGKAPPRAADVIARGRRVMRQVALAQAWALLTKAPTRATPRRPARPKESLCLARKLPYVLEGVATMFDRSGCPTSSRTGRPADASIRSGAFAGQIGGGRVALLLGHQYGGNPDDALEVLARQEDGTLRLWTEGDRLHFRARLRDTRLGRVLAEKARRGEVSGMSAGYTVLAAAQYGDHQACTEGELTEISILTDEAKPAYPGTSCELLHVSTDVSIHDPEFRQHAAASGLARAKRQLGLRLRLGRQ